MRFLNLRCGEWKGSNGASVNSGSVFDIQFTMQVVYRVNRRLSTAGEASGYAEGSW